jgi:Rha family phage regulatory protein
LEIAHVLDAIDRLVPQVIDSFGKPNFWPSEYSVINNLGFEVKERMYQMTKDGFVLLVMGFTGKRALGFKVAYIEAFNAMEQYIRVQHTGLTARYFEQLAKKSPAFMAAGRGSGAARNSRWRRACRPSRRR